MIITLSIADFIYLLSFLFVSHLPFDIPEKFAVYIVNLPFGFSIFWSFGISSFLYKLISQNRQAPDPSQYYKRSLIVFLLLSLTTTAILYTYNQYHPADEQGESLKQLMALIFDAFYVVPMILTSFYYKKCIRVLAEDYCFSPRATQQFIKTLSRYSLVQLLTIGPFFLYIGLTFLFPIEIEELTALTLIFAGLAGFSNCMVYFFTRDGFAASAESSMKNNDTTACESFYEDNDDCQRQLKIQAYT